MAAAMTVGALLRLRSVKDPVQESGSDYRILAESLQTSRSLEFTTSEGPSARRGVLYPALLAAVEPVPVGGTGRALRLQAALGVIAVAYAGVLAAVICSPLAGLLAAFGTALHPILVRSVASYAIESFYGFLVLSAALSLALWLRRPSRRGALMAGLCVGAGIMCRSTLFLFPIFLAVALRLARKTAPVPRRQLVLFVAASFLALAPWVLRNSIALRAFIPFERNTFQDTLFAASTGAVQFDSTQLDLSGCRPATADCLLSATRRELRAHPWRYVATSMLRLARSLAYYPLVTLLAFFGLLLARPGASRLALGAIVAYFFLIYVPFASVPRFIEPVLPCLIVLAGCAAAWPVERALARFAVRSPSVEVDPRPWSWLAHGAVAAVYILGCGYLAAETALRIAPCRLPPTAAGLFYCGLSLEREGSPGEAMDRFRAVQALGAGSRLAGRARLRLAVLEWKAGRGDAAARGLPAAVAAVPELVHEAAMRLQDSGDLRGARLFLDQLVSGRPDDADFLIDRAVLAFLAGRKRDMEADLAKALRIDPGSARGLDMRKTLKEIRRGGVRPVAH